ncbi:MAG TPA: histidine kinase dimerization/phosphoacceptor domain -containing protein [Caulobacteraceae bacterium]|jgi:two-component sensor histidine kinase|nr:histidine kinase dimerization/phosphoacceptor domain -containing protein [Caulobacteraceae bacterium]
MHRLAAALTTIRFRLGAALALALLPVLFLGVIQVTVAFHKDSDAQRTNLALAAARSAATARARMESASVLLETLAPQSIGPACAERLAEISHRLGGYENLIRFGPDAVVTCSAAPVPPDPTRRASDWFSRLAAGEPSLAVRAPDNLSPGAPGLLAGERLASPEGDFEGVVAAVISLQSLRPTQSDPALPPGAEVALADAQGHLLTRTDAAAFPANPVLDLQKVKAQGSVIGFGPDQRGDPRVYSAAPLMGDVFVVLSAPSEGWFSWAKLNPLSGVAFPLLAFVTALVAVMMVTERVVVRWLHYLRRIALIYARGRFTVRPVQADRAPPEIRDLAHSMATMAEAIETRDTSLLDTLAQKDALMREIHHRVRNNLQVISSLLSMQQRALADPAAREAMFDTRQRINALALIYRALYQGVDLKRVDIRQFLGDLVAQLIVEQQEHGELIATELEADELIIDPDKLAPLALFAVEAISNAQKHALALRGGLLRVKFTVAGEEAELAIIDEGSGAAPELAGTGVGRALMMAFARQLRGRMELAPNDHGGVTAKLVFPTPQARGAGPARTPAKSKGNRAAA